MERDIRRDLGQWRGCHTFQDIITTGGKQKRSGGLTMGETYYYYYEVDGSHEIHDPSMPSTNVCPYLPGQTVNTLDVPIECALKRLRSASMNSIRPADFRTMDPGAKFTTPRPAPPAPHTLGPRLGTSAGIRLNHKASSRSLSPAPTPGWTGKARRLFGLRPSSRSSDRVQTPDSFASEDAVSSVKDEPRLDGARSMTPSEGYRSRDLSPERLRKLLSEDVPVTQPFPAQTQQLTIPDDIVEENEDDENFATSAISDNLPFTTLSPPPFQRSWSSSSATDHKSRSTTTIVPESSSILQTFYNEDEALDNIKRGSITSFMNPTSRTQYPYSTASSTVTSPITSPQSLDFPSNNTNFSFFDELTEDDDRASTVLDEAPDVQYSQQPFNNYSLPAPLELSNRKQIPSRITNSFGSPELIVRNEVGDPFGNTSLLTLKGIDAGLDDLVSELGWIANAI
ncbi:hypothetical protein TruAng_002937 [Truncatella angustata]|nr:hypothetical protein TruAng_002937 [Truncatella angustata]